MADTPITPVSGYADPSTDPNAPQGAVTVYGAYQMIVNAQTGEKVWVADLTPYGNFGPLQQVEYRRGSNVQAGGFYIAGTNEKVLTGNAARMGVVEAFRASAGLPATYETLGGRGLTTSQKSGFPSQPAGAPSLSKTYGTLIASPSGELVTSGTAFNVLGQKAPAGSTMIDMNFPGALPQGTQRSDLKSPEQFLALAEWSTMQRAGYSNLLGLGDEKTSSLAKNIQQQQPGLSYANAYILALNTQYEGAKTPKATQFFLGEISKSEQNRYERSSAYHYVGKLLDMPIPANPFEYQGDLAVELLKGSPTMGKDVFSPVSGSLASLLPNNGMGIQQYQWNLAKSVEKGTAAPAKPDFTPAILAVIGAEGKYGPYGSLWGGPNYVGTPSSEGIRQQPALGTAEDIAAREVFWRTPPAIGATTSAQRAAFGSTEGPGTQVLLFNKAPIVESIISTPKGPSGTLVQNQDLFKSAGPVVTGSVADFVAGLPAPFISRPSTTETTRPIEEWWKGIPFVGGFIPGGILVPTSEINTPLGRSIAELVAPTQKTTYFAPQIIPSISAFEAKQGGVDYTRRFIVEGKPSASAQIGNQIVNIDRGVITPSVTTIGASPLEQKYTGAKEYVQSFLPPEEQMAPALLAADISNPLSMPYAIESIITGRNGLGRELMGISSQYRTFREEPFMSAGGFALGGVLGGISRGASAVYPSVRAAAGEGRIVTAMDKFITNVAPKALGTLYAADIAGRSTDYGRNIGVESAGKARAIVIQEAVPMGIGYGLVYGAPESAAAISKRIAAIDFAGPSKGGKYAGWGEEAVFGRGWEKRSNIPSEKIQNLGQVNIGQRPSRPGDITIQPMNRPISSVFEYGAPAAKEPIPSASALSSVRQRAEIMELGRAKTVAEMRARPMGAQKPIQEIITDPFLELSAKGKGQPSLREEITSSEFASRYRSEIYGQPASAQTRLLWESQMRDIMAEPKKTGVMPMDILPGVGKIGELRVMESDIIARNVADIVAGRTPKSVGVSTERGIEMGGAPMSERMLLQLVNPEIQTGTRFGTGARDIGKTISTIATTSRVKQPVSLAQQLEILPSATRKTFETRTRFDPAKFEENLKSVLESEKRYKTRERTSPVERTSIQKPSAITSSIKRSEPGVGIVGISASTGNAILTGIGRTRPSANKQGQALKPIVKTAVEGKSMQTSSAVSRDLARDTLNAKRLIQVQTYGVRTSAAATASPKYYQRGVSSPKGVTGIGGVSTIIKTIETPRPIDTTRVGGGKETTPIPPFIPKIWGGLPGQGTSGTTFGGQRGSYRFVNKYLYGQGVNALGLFRNIQTQRPRRKR